VSRVGTSLPGLAHDARQNDVENAHAVSYNNSSEVLCDTATPDIPWQPFVGSTPEERRAGGCDAFLAPMLRRRTRGRFEPCSLCDTLTRGKEWGLGFSKT